MNAPSVSNPAASDRARRRKQMTMLSAVAFLVVAGGMFGVIRWQSVRKPDEPLVDVYDPVRGGSNYPRINRPASTAPPAVRTPTTRRSVPPVRMPAPSAKPV